MKRYSYWAVLALGVWVITGCGGHHHHVTSANYTFYATGLDLLNDFAVNGPSTYSIAGVVTIDSDGNVTGGEQDYNDGFGVTSPQPSGDKITGGSLTQTTGTQQGTLTIKTNNPAVGVNGTETFAIQVVNDDHGLIIQYDGSATSSGSFDLQTLQTSGTGKQATVTGPSGNFAFTFTGYALVDQAGDYDPIVSGGIFAVSGTSLSNGTVDINDLGTPSLGNAFGATIGAPDSLGGGTISDITTTQFAIAIKYYIVNSKVLRMIVVDPTASFVGSAYSQGTGTFSNTSIGQSVFSALTSTFGFNLYSVAGMFGPADPPAVVPGAPKPEGGLPQLTFSGVADAFEDGSFVNAAPIVGHWAIGSNGYGGLVVTSANLLDITTFGAYVTDPTLNLVDPNNTTSGAGAALLAEMDGLVGTGTIVPQTDTKTASFTGTYGFGAQEFNDLSDAGWELDFLGQGSMTSLAFSSATGFVSDPFGALTSTPASAVTFTGTAVPDDVFQGRYTMSGEGALTVAFNATASSSFTTTIYQAYGGYLAWIQTDETGTFGGSLQSLTSASAASKPAAHLLRILQH
jgi:hypothetical protein